MFTTVCLYKGRFARQTKIEMIRFLESHFLFPAKLIAPPPSSNNRLWSPSLDTIFIAMTKLLLAIYFAVISAIHGKSTTAITPKD